MALHGHLFRSLAIVHVAAVFHAAVIPVSSAPSCSIYLWRRRSRVWKLAFGLLLVLGAFNILKGPDVGEALLAFAAAGLLWWARRLQRAPRADPGAGLAAWGGSDAGGNGWAVHGGGLGVRAGAPQPLAGVPHDRRIRCCGNRRR